MKKRVLGRAEHEAKTTGNVRSDDNEETLLKRFNTFKVETIPIIEKYHN
jgi:adenylate kinase family enzyme